MEDILRDIYARHSLPPKKYDQISSLRRNYIFADLSTRSTQIQNTTFSRKESQDETQYPLRDARGTIDGRATINEETRFDKQFYSIQPIDKSISNKYKMLGLPSITKADWRTANEYRTRIRRTLRSAITAVLFSIRLRRVLEKVFTKKRARTAKYSKDLLKIIMRLVTNYYQKLLETELGNYNRMIRFIADGNKITHECIDMLESIAAKLASSTITKEMFTFLTLIAGNHSFVPSDFLSVLEINRLQFSLNYGCTTAVTPEQSYMLIGLCLGIKVFCFYILYRPWLIFPELEEECSKKAVRNFISNVGSIFYFMILEQCCQRTKEIRSVSREALQIFSISPLATLNPFETATLPASGHIIADQKRRYLTTCQQKYSRSMLNIKMDLQKWMNRITHTCLKQISHPKEEVSEKTRNGGLLSRFSK